ncbi:recombinase family protein [Escherichia coli]|uniref:recombinase family protein n=1 Tax=Buttiauxella noackiae TaxID=82992 RepID=UPI0019DD3463|nr:recombinase family protein [Escherichia coli]MBJ0329711.1 recombinase family protein [Escherichia coli]
MTTFIYARVSTKDGQTIENQKHTITTARKDAFMLICDEGISGKVHPLKREGFNRLFRLAKRGDVIVVTAYDRVSRNTRHFLEMLDMLKSKGVALVSLRENIDTTTSQGYLMATQFMAFAQYERDLIGERTRSALIRLKSEGVSLGRPVTKAGQDAVELLKSGVSVQEVMRITGMSKAGVYKVRKSIC